MNLNRRKFLQQSFLGSGLVLIDPALPVPAADSGIKIKKISYFEVPDNRRGTFSQRKDIVLVECDNGLTGVGEGGSPDLIRNLAGYLIGQDPMQSEHLWQMLFRGQFYPAGRELQHAIGALDIALWDIKGKLLKTPVFNLLGGQLRHYIECYSTGYPSQGNLKDTARACVQAGFKAFRFGGSNNTNDPFDEGKVVEQTYADCEQIKAGVDGIGEWSIDFHTRFNRPNAVRLANMIEKLDPFFAEDLIRSENQELYRLIREQTNIPLALGEQFGVRWDFNFLVENDLMDYARVTLPNVAGVTEYKKIMAMCETHYIGMIPHFTGPVATAALTHCLAAFTGIAMMEILGGQPIRPDYLNPDYLDFREGKLYPVNKPGLGVEFFPDKVVKVLEIDQPVSGAPPVFRRPDGSYTNW